MAVSLALRGLAASTAHCEGRRLGGPIPPECGPAPQVDRWTAEAGDAVLALGSQPRAGW